MEEEKNKGKKIEIIVNLEEKVVTHEVLSFVDVLNLAFPAPRPIPDAEYSITYKDAKSQPHKGSLHPGGTVEVKKHTKFDVTATKQS